MNRSSVSTVALDAACAMFAIVGCAHPTIVCPEGAKPVWGPSLQAELIPDARVLACVGPDGIQQGYSFGYVGDRLMTVGHYVDGKLDGSTVIWHASGRRWLVGDFDAGEPTGTTTEWNEAGIKVWEEILGAPGEPSISTGWYDDGTLKYTIVSVGDEFHGEYERYYANGQLKTRGQYVHSRRHGTWTCWDESGKSRVDTVYDQGEVVSSSGDTDDAQAMEACERGCAASEGTSVCRSCAED